MYAIYFLFKISVSRSYSCILIVKKIWENSNSWIQFLQRSCRILPPFLDNLDIFHIQWAKTLVQYSEFIEQIKCPVVLSLRGAHINYSPLIDKNLIVGYKKYFPFISGFHAVSTAIAKESEKYHADPRKIAVIKPAVHQKIMKLSGNTNKSEKIFKIVSIGRCHWKKGYTFALDAMTILKKEGIQFHYTIVAAGKDHENILYQIYDLGLSEHVTFINGLPHNRVLDQLIDSNLFLLSSLSEGISNSVLEAMSLGVPVLTTDCGGMGEVIKNGENGFLVPVRDPDSIAIELINIIKMDSSKVINVIKSAKQTILENHLLKLQIKKMITLYESIINSYNK